MRPRLPDQLMVIVDRLHGLRRWVWGVTLLGFVVADGDSDLRVAWTCFVLVALLVWLPMMVRLPANVRALGRAFKEGLDSNQAVP